MSDFYTQQSVRLENLKEGEARKIVQFLRAVHKDLLEDKLPNATTEWSRERYDRMVGEYGKMLSNVYDKKILPDLFKTGLEFVKHQTPQEETALVEEVQKGKPKMSKVPAQFREPIRKVVEESVLPVYVSPDAIFVAATSEPFQGKLLSTWADELSRKDYRLVSASLRTSWIEGETLAAATNRLMPILKQSQRSIMTITRSYYGQLASETRDRVWAANSDIIERLVWDSILDNRTTPTICAPRDQLEYTLKGEPIGHDLPYLGGPGNAHWQCRSHSFPVAKGVERQVMRPAISAGSKYESGDNLTRSGRVRKNTKDSRDRDIYRPQKVKVGTTYTDWLKRQPAAFQDDILGKAKGKAFRAGEYQLGEKFTPQNPKTLDQHKKSTPKKKQKSLA